MLIFYLVLSIGVSFFCSLFEAVILSISPAFVASIMNSPSGTPSRWSQLLNKQKSQIDDSLAAILTLNTISHTIGAAGVGAEILKLYGNEYVALGSAILTILILFVSEIVPKTLGATHTRFFAPLTAYGIRFFVFITYPIVLICKLLSGLIGADSELKQITREEIAYTAKIGQEEGSLTEDEAMVISNLLRLRKLKVRDIMTPRTVVFALDDSLTVGDVFGDDASPIIYSRIPIYHKDIDQITGMVFRFDLLSEFGENNSDKLISEISKPIHSISDQSNIASALDTFIKRKEHLFSVHDEHGGFEGVVTLEDVIETILGIEITDESDSVEDLRLFAKKKWEERQQKRQKKD